MNKGVQRIAGYSPRIREEVGRVRLQSNVSFNMLSANWTSNPTCPNYITPDTQYMSLKKDHSQCLELFRVHWGLDTRGVFGKICIERVDVDGSSHFTIFTADFTRGRHGICRRRQRDKIMAFLGFGNPATGCARHLPSAIVRNRKQYLYTWMVLERPVNSGRQSETY